VTLRRFENQKALLSVAFALVRSVVRFGFNGPGRVGSGGQPAGYEVMRLRQQFPAFLSVSLFDLRIVSSSRPAARPGRRAPTPSRLGVAAAAPQAASFPAHALTAVSTMQRCKPKRG
jgi:hypothetical protein